MDQYNNMKLELIGEELNELLPQKEKEYLEIIRLRNIEDRNIRNNRKQEDRIHNFNRKEFDNKKKERDKEDEVWKRDNVNFF